MSTATISMGYPTRTGCNGARRCGGAVFRAMQFLQLAHQLLIPDVDEMEYNGVDNLVTDMDNMEQSAANEGVSPTGSATTGQTSNTMTEEISTARRYPHREHHSPSRYNFI